MTKKSISTLLLGLFFFLLTWQLEAKPAEFEFYYQRVQKKVELYEPVVPAPEPGFWNKVKWIGKKIGTTAKQAWYSLAGSASLIREQFFPKDEGRVRLYSRSEPNTAWDLKRFKITSEEQLLKVMGVTDPAKMSREQQGVLESFRFCKSQFIQDRNKLSYKNTIRFFFTEAGQYANDSAFGDDFWPHSRGNLINVSDSYFAWRDPKEAAQTLIAHEFGHSYDRTIRENGSYGADNSHYVNELTTPKAAWVEGWAIWNEMVVSEDEREYVKNTIKRVKKETSQAGKYNYFDATDPKLSGKDLLSNEGYVAATMYGFSSQVENGEAKILKSFAATNSTGRDFSKFCRDLIKQNPGDALKIIEILDRTLLFKLTEAELTGFFGTENTAKIKDHLARVRPTLQNPAPTEVAVDPTSSTSATTLTGSSGGGNATAAIDNLTLRQAFYEFTEAKRKYKEAVTGAAPQEEVLRLHTIYLEKLQVYKDLEQGRETLEE